MAYLCPACHRASLTPIYAGPVVARCERCAWSTDDLLVLIPTQPTPFAGIVLGRGAWGLVRAAGLLLAIAGLGWLVLGRH